MLLPSGPPLRSFAGTKESVGTLELRSMLEIGRERALRKLEELDAALRARARHELLMAKWRRWWHVLLDKDT